MNESFYFFIFCYQSTLRHKAIKKRQFHMVKNEVVQRWAHINLIKRMCAVKESIVSIFFAGKLSHYIQGRYLHCAGKSRKLIVDYAQEPHQSIEWILFCLCKHNTIMMPCQALYTNQTMYFQYSASSRPGTQGKTKLFHIDRELKMAWEEGYQEHGSKSSI